LVTKAGVIGHDTKSVDNEFLALFPPDNRYQLGAGHDFGAIDGGVSVGKPTG
jgi:hypothetical protein